jgi:hypothetical protein
VRLILAGADAENPAEGALHRETRQTGDARQLGERDGAVEVAVEVVCERLHETRLGVQPGWFAAPAGAVASCKGGENVGEELTFWRDGRRLGQDGRQNIRVVRTP